MIFAFLKCIFCVFNTIKRYFPNRRTLQVKKNELADYFSEAGLIKYRVLIEIEYFIALCTIPVPQLSDFDSNLFENLLTIYKKFSFEDAKAIKEIENVTNHDVKAVEYFIKQKFDALNLSAYKEFIHFDHFTRH